MTEKEMMIAICERTNTEYKIIHDGNSICIYGGYNRDIFVDFTKDCKVKGFI